MRRTTAALAVTMAALCAAALAEDRQPVRSATEFLSPEMRAEQADRNRNPAMLWVQEGERLWSKADGKGSTACAGCHGDARRSMRGVAARYPAFDTQRARLMNLELRINTCRTDYQRAPALAYESEPLLALTAYVAIQSIGMPVAIATTGPAAPHIAAGRRFWTTPQGQFDLACRQCHSENVGRRMRGDTISSGLGTGYPAYRLAWQTIGSLHRRLNVCQKGVRAEDLEPGSPQHLALELFLATRALGQPLEAPGLRR
ncbi:MAG: sulfur oxidation c-type cytochrome SoxA [Hyphomicrobiaceae bacterium]|nr:sulfur oxidation c-type cytochrome SoxA [Hyphomicrobiaceae bacterium]